MAHDWRWGSMWTGRILAWVHGTVAPQLPIPRPRQAPGSWIETAGRGSCKHEMGSYADGEVMDGQKVVARHYRCNGCDIIVKTKHEV